MQEDLIKLAACYPQLALPIRAGMRQTEEYKAAVLAGEPVENEPRFRHPEDISVSTEDTPAGRAVILSVGDREDFLHAYRALAYRCEPEPIPDSVGAVTVRGLINWEKIHGHRDEYLKAGGTDWDAEFARFTADKKNYLDSVIILSGGDYSNVPASDLGLSPAAWKTKSFEIRKYHELTHFVCRGLCPDDIDALRDEVIADSIGLTAAFGRCEARLVLRFLGVWDGVYHEGGRLSHYVKDGSIPEAAARVSAMSDDYAGRIEREQSGAGDIFDLLLRIFP